MFAQKFFTLFPPPKFLNVPYAGLDISDDAVRCIEYVPTGSRLAIHRYGTKLLPPGTIEGGEIKNDKVLQETIAALCGELKVHVVKASLPEEKMYLFKTEVSSTNEKEIRQSVEFKLEENVPLAAAEAIFFFDALPKVVETDANYVSVSVAPRPLVLSYLDLIKSAGVTVLSFEVQAKAIAHSLSVRGSVETEMIVYIMGAKTGIYIICGGVVCFTSTISWGSRLLAESKDSKATFRELKKQLEQVHLYWSEHAHGSISRIVFAGRAALTDGLLSECSAGFLGQSETKIHFELGKVWQNAFSYDAYIPPIPYEDSLDYAVAAGLALPPILQ